MAVSVNGLEFSNSVSSTNTYYGTAIRLPPGGVNGFSAHAEWGNVTGTFTLWFSDKEDPSTADDSDWKQNPLNQGFVTNDGLGGTLSALNPAGSAGGTFQEFSGSSAKWLRIKYVNGSGSGTVKVWMNLGSSGR